MKTIHLLIMASFLYLLGMNACTNELEDLDILGMGDSSFQLEQIMEYSEGISETAKTQMTNSFLRNTGKKELSMTKGDLTPNDFFGTGQACFPAYSESMAYFDLFPYDSLINDTLKFHFRMKFLEDYVDSILNDDIDYKVYEMKWKHKGSVVTTIALYDSNDGLVYDNILFNIIDSKYKSGNNSKRRLSRSEYPGGYYAMGSDHAFFVNSYGYTVAESYLSWYEYGHMGSAAVYGSHENIIEIDYFYVHDRIDHYIDTCSNNSNYTIINRFKDFSSSSEAKIIYCLWAGPTDFKPVDVNVGPYFNYYTPNLEVDLSIHIPDNESINEEWRDCFTNGFIKAWNYQAMGHIEYY